MPRGPQPGFPQSPISQQHQVNGPSLKSMPPSSVQSLNQASTGGPIRGISPAPNHQTNLGSVPSPVGSSTGQTKSASPCPSPSVSAHRSMPPSPAAAQLNSPHPGLSPRPESVSSPRTDPGSLKQEQAQTHASATPNMNQQQVSTPNQQEQGQAQTKPDAPQPPVHPAPQPGMHMMPPQQMRMMPAGPNGTPQIPGAPYQQSGPGNAMGKHSLSHYLIQTTVCSIWVRFFS